MSNNDKGALVAKALAGAWRREPPAFDLTLEELTIIAPLLLGSGAGALGWWRVRDTHLKTAAVAGELQRAYQFHAIRAALHEQELREVVALLRAADVEPILVKGWAIGRLYPETGLRPYGDLDLCFRPEQFSKAVTILETPDCHKYHVDMHDGFAKLDGVSAGHLYAGSQLVRLGDTDVRVLSPEDHLRLLCTHLLQHGAYRPLWLCDVAVALESRAASFDWDRCLTADRRKADWVACTIGLAHRLLGVEIADMPRAARARKLPGWLLSHVLKQWQAPYATRQSHLQMRYDRPMAHHLLHPAGALAALRRRWPDPLEATFKLRGAANDLPRLPFQIGYGLLRAARFLAELPKSRRSS
ncbi:MAG TPA: nucleotidyltransferase family protein [Blastocatellia bacterium]|nr:nucleotidyltransferase family protein [Blastocatellia bacterium]